MEQNVPEPPIPTLIRIAVRFNGAPAETAAASLTEFLDEQGFAGVIFEEEPLCPECARPMQAKSGGKERTQRVSDQIAGEWGGKGGFSGESGVNIFTCPECTADKAFPGMQPGEEPQCPICAIPMKAKYVEEE
jgi:hypothetical protein